MWWLLRGSLPELDGELALPGLSGPVTVQRDALGVVTIDAANETDAMRALGYVHAQERYFEMDLLRRTAAGELAELFGPVAVGVDKEHRIHRFRARVEADLHSILGAHRANAAGAGQTDSSAHVLASIGAARRKRTFGYISYRLRGTNWWRIPTDSPHQPEDGFTVPAWEDENELEILCRTYEHADDEGRRLIRLVAELSVRPA